MSIAHRAIYVVFCVAATGVAIDEDYYDVQNLLLADDTGDFKTVAKITSITVNGGKLCFGLAAATGAVAAAPVATAVAGVVGVGAGTYGAIQNTKKLTSKDPMMQCDATSKKVSVALWAAGALLTTAAVTGLVVVSGGTAAAAAPFLLAGGALTFTGAVTNEVLYKQYCEVYAVDFEKCFKQNMKEFDCRPAEANFDQCRTGVENLCLEKVLTAVKKDTEGNQVMDGKEANRDIIHLL